MTLTIEFGALCEPIKNQVEKQGYTISEKDSEMLQEIADSIIKLKLHGIIPDSIVRQAQEKLMKNIVRSIQNYSESIKKEE